MNQGIYTVIYPVKDIAKARALFRQLLSVEPYADAPHYTGFKVGNQDIGLDPNGHQDGMTAYYHVDDITKSVKSLVDSGAKPIQEVKDVGGGRLIAAVKDENGNIIGLIQDQGQKPNNISIDMVYMLRPALLINGFSKMQSNYLEKRRLI